MYEFSSKTSRGANVKFEDDEMITRLNCYCHILHNVVGTMCSIPVAEKIVTDVSTLVTFIKRSGLGEKCNPQLKKHVETRWNTVFEMFHSVLVNYSQIGRIFLEKEEADSASDVMSKLTVISRSDLDSLCTFLEKMREWTLFLEKDKVPTAWMVWPIYLRLNKHLTDLPNDTEIIRAMKNAGRSYIEKNIADFAPKMLHKVCTVLHPLLKNIAMTSPADRSEVYDFINAEISKNDMAVDNVESTDLFETQGTSNMELINEFMGEQNLVTSQQQQQEPSDYSAEFQTYLHSNVPIQDPFTFDLTKWWFEHRHTYKKLFDLFVAKAGVTASSAPAERGFSQTGIIISPHRSNIIPETVSELILAKNKYSNFV